MAYSDVVCFLVKKQVEIWSLPAITCCEAMSDRLYRLLDKKMKKYFPDQDQLNMLIS